MSPDIVLFRLINLHEPIPLLDSLMVFMTNKAYLFFFLFLAIAVTKEGKRALLPISLLIIAWALSDGIGNILKNAIERPRPFLVIEDVRMLVGHRSSFSFPSNHAATYTAGATLLWYFFRYLRIPALLIVLIVAISRVYVGVHYPSDVIGGAVIGLIIGISVINIFKRLNELYIKDRQSAIFFIALLFLLFGRLYYISYGPLELSGDEAHYWEWSRRPDLSYYSKGPLIAYLIGITTSIGGSTELGVRFLAPFFLFFSSIIIYRLAKSLYGDSRVAVLSGLLVQFVPLFSAYGVIMTIDSPFLFFWSLSLYFFHRAIASTSTGWWIALGLSSGLGMLAKYSMAFFFISGLIYLIIDKDKRGLLKKGFPYLSVIITGIVFLPVVVWNIDNNFVTLRHTAGHLGIYEGLGLRPKYFFEFIGSQIGVITPLFFFSMMVAIVSAFLKDGISGRERFLFSFSLPVIVFFLLKGLQAKVQANWSLMAYHTLFIFTSWWFVSRWSELKRAIKILFVSSIVFLLFIFPLLHFPSVLGLPPQLDPSARLRGWKELGKRVSEISEEMRESGPFFVVSDKYQVSSLLAFYTKGNPVTYCVNLGRRMNQYDLWPGFDEFVHYNAIFVTIGNHRDNEFLQSFSECQREIMSVRERQYSIFKCFDFKGTEKKAVFERY
ncbi:MAG: glycosyltransferase family 39 protein [Thermodesulfovibrionales bacterium]